MSHDPSIFDLIDNYLVTWFKNSVKEWGKKKKSDKSSSSSTFMHILAIGENYLIKSWTPIVFITILFQACINKYVAADLT